MKMKYYLRGLFFGIVIITGAIISLLLLLAFLARDMILKLTHKVSSGQETIEALSQKNRQIDNHEHYR